MTDMWSMKEMIQCVALGIPKETKKCNFCFYCFCLDFFIRNENITSEECKTKTVWNNIACRASYKPSKSGGQKIMSRSNAYKWMFYFWLPFQLWNRNCIFFFIPLGIPTVTHWIISFMLHISVITSPTNWYLYRWVSWNISEVIDENSTSAFNYLDDFRSAYTMETFNLNP